MSVVVAVGGGRWQEENIEEELKGGGRRSTGDEAEEGRYSLGVGTGGAPPPEDDGAPLPLEGSVCGRQVLFLLLFRLLPPPSPAPFLGRSRREGIEAEGGMQEVL